MRIRDFWEEFARGMRDAFATRTLPAEDQTAAGRALAVADQVQREARQLPLGSPTRMRLQQIAEELRAYAAGERAKAALADSLDNPAIRQILKNANIKLD